MVRRTTAPSGGQKFVSFGKFSERTKRILGNFFDYSPDIFDLSSREFTKFGVLLRPCFLLSGAIIICDIL